MKKARFIVTISICCVFLLNGSTHARIAISAGSTPTAVPHRARITIDNADQLMPYAKIGAVDNKSSKPNINSTREIVWSPNNRDLVIITQPSNETLRPQVLLYDTSKPGSAPITLAGPNSYRKCIAFHPDGKSFVGCDADGNVILQDIATGIVKQTYLSPQGFSVVSVALSPNGAWLAASYYKDTDGSSTAEVILWNTVTGGIQKYLRTPSNSYVDSLVFSPGGSWLAALNNGGSIFMWSATSGQLNTTFWRPRLDREYAPYLERVTFSDDGRFLIASEGEDGYSFIWARANWNKITVLEHSWAAAANPVRSEIAYSTTEGCCNDSSFHYSRWKISLQDLSDGQPRVIFDGPNGWVTSMAYSPDGTKLAFSTSYDGNLEILDLATAQEHVIVQGVQYSAISVSFIQNTNQLATLTTYQEGTLRLWNADSGQGEGIYRCCVDNQFGSAISPDGKLWAYESTGDNTASIYVRDLSTGNEIATINQLQEFMEPFIMVFSPDSNILATGGTSGEILLWNVRQNRLIGKLTGFGEYNYIGGLKFSLDSKTLVTASTDGTARSWDVETFKPLTVIKSSLEFYAPKIAISPDNVHALSSESDDTFQLWNMRTGEVIAKGLVPGVWLEDMTFSPDGKLIAGVDWRGTVILWDFKTGRTVSKSIQGNLYSIAFSSDGTILAVGGDGAFFLLHVPTQEF